MPEYRRNLICVICIGYIIFVPSPTMSFDLMIGYVGLNVPQSILLVTEEAGLFDKNGINSKLIFFTGGSTGISAMIAGEVPIVQSVGPEVPFAVSNGANIVVIAVAVPKVTMAVVTDKKITTPEQLRGKKLAVSRFGSLSDGALRLALTRVGLKAEDVRLLQLGSAVNRLAALQTGQIDGTIVTMDFAIQARNLGFNSVLDLQKMGIELPQTGLATTPSYIAQYPDVVRKVIKAYVEGIHYFVTREKDTINIIQKHLKLKDSRVASEMYQYVRGSIARKPYVVREGMQNSIQVVMLQIPEARKLTAERMIDNRFISELDKSGYIDRLYR